MQMVNQWIQQRLSAGCAKKKKKKKKKESEPSAAIFTYTIPSSSGLVSALQPLLKDDGYVVEQK